DTNQPDFTISEIIFALQNFLNTGNAFPAFRLSLLFPAEECRIQIDLPLFPAIHFLKIARRKKCLRHGTIHWADCQWSSYQLYDPDKEILRFLFPGHIRRPVPL